MELVQGGGLQGRVRAHFGSSIAHDFPAQLLTVKYEMKHSQLVLSADHQYGQQVAHADLHLWPHLRRAFDMAASYPYTVRSASAAGHPDVDEELIRYLVETAQSLTFLDIAGCAISLGGLRLLGGLPGLQHLNLSGILSVDDSALQTISGISLTSLDISHCTNVTDAGLQSVSSLRDSLLSLKAGSSPHFTHIGVNTVLMKCELLELLDVSRCPKLTFLGIVLWTHGVFQFVSRRLRTLNVDSCTALHPQSLNWVSSALGGLEDLSMKNVPGVTDSVVRGVLGGCRLRRLHYR
ncbi:hypothetical protein B484DRAFT_399450 [Ochromonadaceae sp. CCMP2298]|nr:hypothetical protein B484DRAFT_399450 [Ochromonadaceae sp. CCMP2298]